MVTRCPSCDTLFRVTPQHLQACRGQVRCGRCMTVFDGFAALATLPVQGALTPSPPSDVEGPARLSGAAPAPARAETGPVAEEPVAESECSVAEAAAAVAESARAPGTPAAVISPEPAEAVPAAMRAVAAPVEVRQEPWAGASEPEQEARARLPRRRATLGWSAGTILMLLMLGGQALYAYRVELAANYPGLKPAVAQFCGLLGCNLPLPQRPKLVTIEASDLQVQDPTRPGVIQLTATLRNHAGFDVGWPALDLVLTNTKEHTLARRIFMPAEYLERERNVSTGLAANAEITVRLVLDTGDLGAAGFRLALLPAR